MSLNIGMDEIDTDGEIDNLKKIREDYEKNVKLALKKNENITDKCHIF